MSGEWLFARWNRSRLRVTGHDRLAFLHNFCTNSVKTLVPGTGCEAFFCNTKGRVLGHSFLFADADSVVIETVAGQDEFLRNHLDRYIITEDVAITNETEQWSRFVLFSTDPQATEFPVAIGAAIQNLPGLGHLSTIGAETSIQAARIDPVVDRSAWQLAVLRDSQSRLEAELQSLGCRLIDEQHLAAWRIAAGFPEFGVDFHDEFLAQEVNRTATAISFKKGCYLGQEPIARLDAMGHVNRSLRKLRLHADQLPARGTEIHTANSTALAANSLQGSITSAAWSPECPQLSGPGEIVAIGVVKEKALQQKLALCCRIGDQIVPVKVLP